MKCIEHLGWWIIPGIAQNFFDVPQGEGWGGEEGKRNIGGRNQGDQMNFFYLYNYHFYSKPPPHSKHSLNIK